MVISTSVSAQPVGERDNLPDGSNVNLNVNNRDATVPVNKPDHEISQCMTSAGDAPNHLRDAFKPQLPELLCQSMCQCFESEYFK